MQASVGPMSSGNVTILMLLYVHYLSSFLLSFPGVWSLLH